MAHRNVIVPNNLPVSDEQRQSILIKMERHDYLAKRQITKLGPLGTDKYSKMWDDFASIINAIGPAVKTSAQWQSYWTQMRLDAKKTMSTYLYNARQTGDNNTNPPSDEIIQISEIFGTYGVGLCIVPEVGIYNTPCRNATVEQDLYVDLIESRTANKTKIILDENDLNDDCHIPASQNIHKILNDFIISSSVIIENFLKKSLNWIKNIECIVNPEPLTIQVAKAQLNYILSHMKKKNESVEILSEELILSEWITLAETLNIIGPSHNPDVWLAYWTQLKLEVEEKKERIKSKQSRARLSEEDLDVLNIINRSSEELKSINTTGKMKSVMLYAMSVLQAPTLSTSQSGSCNGNLSHPNSAQKQTVTSSQSRAPKTLPPKAVTSSSSEGIQSTKSVGKANQSSCQSDNKRPSTSSGRTSQKMLHHKSIAAIEDSNEMITTLAGHLLDCFKQHTQILENALNQFNTSLEHLINQIVIAFLNDDGGQNNVEDAPGPENQIQEKNQVQQDDYEDADYQMEYLDEDGI